MEAQPPTAKDIAATTSAPDGRLSSASSSESDLSQMSPDELYAYAKRSLEQTESDDDERQERQTQCLFCDDTLPSPLLVLRHLQSIHDVDLQSLASQLDCYEYLQLVNFIRAERPSAKLFRERRICLPESAWKRREFLRATVREDPMLTILLAGRESDPPPDPASDKVVVLEKEMDDLWTGDDGNAIDLPSLSETSADPDGDKLANAKRREDDDADYFDTYSHLAIHEEMIKDEVRTGAYFDTLMQLSDWIRGRTVLDVGCGTGILSCFAARAGAARVIGVDRAEIVTDAWEIVAENGLMDKIQLIRSSIENVSLGDVDKVDLILSEWMGYFLLYENMLESIIVARQRFLREDGLIVPNVASMHLAGVSDDEVHHNMITYWDDAYGLKMSRIRRLREKTPCIDAIKPERLCTSAAVLKRLDLMTCAASDCEFSADVRLVAQRSARLTALVGWFDVGVVLKRGADELHMLSTSPMLPETHWKQTLFYLPQPLALSENEAIDVRATIVKHPKYARGLRISYRIERADAPTLELHYDML